MKTLLIVDDSQDDVDIIQAAITEEGLPITLEIASTGEDGLDALCRYKPDLVLLDLNMPGMSGFDVLREMQARAELRSMPVLVLSNSHREEDRQAAIAYGARAYTPKFTDYEDLKVYLRSAYEFWRRSR